MNPLQKNQNIFPKLETYLKALQEQKTCPKVGGALHTALPQRGVFPAVPRIIAIGDVHGDFDILARALYKANIMNRDGHWIASNTMVIQVGDLLDGGGRDMGDATDNYREEIDILMLIEHLNKQASAEGGAFLNLIGNHELMNVMGDFRHVTKSGIEGLGGESKRKQLFQPGGPLAKRLGCSSYGICKIGDWTFVHGGILPKHLKNKSFSIQNINNMVQDILTGFRKKEQLNSDEKDLIFGDNNIFWTRQLSDPSPNCTVVNESIKLLNNGIQKGGIVVGHTVQNNINQKCGNGGGGGVWRIDKGMSRAFGKKYPRDENHIQVLQILNNHDVSVI
jgi:hypothetical protein